MTTMPDTLNEALSNSLNEDADLMLTISNDLRTIAPSGPYLFGVYNDTNVHTLSFTIPRFYDTEDFGDYSISINIQNAANKLEVVAASNVVVAESAITFDWILKKFVFEKEGTVYFNIRLATPDESKIFHTTVYKGIVLEGLEVDATGRQSTLYRLELLRDEALASGDDEVAVGTETFTSGQLTELVNYLDT